MKKIIFTSITGFFTALAFITAGSVAAKTLDCKTNISCFVAKSKTCSASKITFSQKLLLSDATLNRTIYQEIKGKKNGNCRVSMKILKHQTKLSNSFIEKLKKTQPTSPNKDVNDLQAKLNESLISETQAKFNKIDRQMVGKSGTCDYKNSDLYNLLTKLKQGKKDLSKDDFGINCTGTIFSTLLSTN